MCYIYFGQYCDLYKVKMPEPKGVYSAPPWWAGLLALHCQHQEMIQNPLCLQVAEYASTLNRRPCLETKVSKRRRLSGDKGGSFGVYAGKWSEIRSRGPAVNQPASARDQQLGWSGPCQEARWGGKWISMLFKLTFI